MSDDTERLAPVSAVDMRRARMAITMADGAQYMAKVMPGDVVKCERQYGIKASAFEQGAALEWMLYIAWMASKRHGYTQDFESFLDQVSDLDIQSDPGATLPSSLAP